MATKPLQRCDRGHRVGVHACEDCLRLMRVISQLPAKAEQTGVFLRCPACGWPGLGRKKEPPPLNPATLETLRDQYAGQAMAAILSNERGDRICSLDNASIATTAFEIAEYMIKTKIMRARR